ncbi:MAG TPA: hypothetical protein VNQ53_07595 [Nocardioides sp.]|nr:hypothetical protein [Nocardioides sp.]
MSAVSVLPCQRTIVAIDIEGSTTRNNSAKGMLRNDMYDLFEAALLDCEITEDLREPYLDRGDGAILFIRPVDEAPRTRLLNQFIPKLSDLLAQHAVRNPRHRFRLRAAIHSGDVHFDRRGAYGEDIDVTVRLLDSPELKTRLQQTDAPLVLVVSEHIYRSVIRHGYDGIDDRTFEPLVHLQVGGQPYRGWVQVPAEARVLDAAIPLRVS